MDTDSSEKPRHSPAAHEAGHGIGSEKQLSSGDVKKRTHEVRQTLESAEITETAEAGGETISESAGEDKARGPTGGAIKSYSTDQIEAIRAKLLKALPPQEVMIRDIRKKLNFEEKNLTKKIKRLRKQAHTHAFELTNLVMQLRNIREFFATLAHATYEIIKHLWLKIVHGV